MTRKSRTAGLVASLWILCPAGGAQKTTQAAGEDHLIEAIETVKRSVAGLDCLALSGSTSRILERVGSAFLVSAAGDFLTAAHVITEMQKPERPCPTLALTVPDGEWRPESRKEPLRWFPFEASGCRLDFSLDIAFCRLGEDFSTRKHDLHLKVVPVEFDWAIPADGTSVAFTGFPLRARDPMTFRGHVAAFRTPWPDEPIPELVLDHASLPGFSGSPVYRASGKVVGILVKDGNEEATGVTMVRPVLSFREILRERRPKE